MRGKAAATIYQNSPPLIFFSPFIHLKSASRICPCQCEMKLQGWFQEHWHEAALGEQSQNQGLLLCNLVGSHFSQTLELIDFRTRILKGANSFFSLYTYSTLKSQFIDLLIEYLAQGKEDISISISIYLFYQKLIQIKSIWIQF